MGKKRRAESRKGMIQMSVAFTPELHRRLAIAALEDRAAIVEIIRDAVSQYLERRDSRGRGRGQS